jgi:thioredoxin-related protein
MNKNFLFILFLSVFISCNNTKQHKADEPNDFILPDVPVVITDRLESYKYIATNYWNNFDFSDSSTYRQTTSYIFADFLSILQHVDLQTALQSMKIMMQKAETDSIAYKRFVDICEKYLYGANSPYRSDELYIPVLQSIIGTNIIDENYKIIAEYRLKMAMKNRIGNKAADFEYTLVSGITHKLYDIKTEFVLLFINNPGCNACKEYTERIQNSQLIQQLIKEKLLTVLAVYPDEDLTEWKKYQTQIPKNWINAYDKKLMIRSNEIYDLRAIPTLYLLDKDKNVLLKDTFVESVEKYLNL